MRFVALAARRDHVVDETDARGLLGRNHFAGEQHLHGGFARYVARQRYHRRRAEQTDIDAGGREFGRLRGDGEIATRHQLAAGRRRRGLDRGNDRLRQVDDLLHHGAASPMMCLK